MKITIVPAIWSLEVANTLLVAERRNRMTQEQSQLAIALLQSLLIHVEEATDSKAFSSTFDLARKEGLAAYDAAYLELAIRLKLPIATLDRRLAEAATRCGVDLVVVDG
ncbi:type II toxin-antitoxin system VapC family toxin [Planktothricoides raciborskii]|uniref:type II toxin-antitoxin system VapC family toxin n=1 Tax=Planktothricoides raciborskii TaxID=132608 RepID=UPI001F558B2D|nr:type II toxin-antitoxin system VapC family toxin [Planktothricoides raciborskii]